MMYLSRKNKIDILTSGYYFYKDSPIGYKVKYIDKESFVLGLADFDIFGIYENDTVYGMIVFDNQNFHISISRSIRGKWCHLLNAIIDYGIKKYGSLLATVDKNNRYVQKLVNRIGFNYSHCTDQYNIYVRY